MKNISTTVENNILTIKIDLTQDNGPSKSGKTRVVASTEGNQKVATTPDGKDVVVGINAYYKP